MSDHPTPTEPESGAAHYESGDGTEAINDVWRRLVSLVIDSRDVWRRDVVATTGLSFSRIRALRRVARRPMTLTQLADAATMDAPAASVAVSDLEAAGLVRREPSPEDRRRKYIHITDAGRAMLQQIWEIPDPAPAELLAASPEQIAVLAEILADINRPADRGQGGRDTITDQS